MPRSIDEGFRDFLSNLTPSTGETIRARNHRASIEQCIKSTFGLRRFWRTGSFGNATSIRGYSDVDFMAHMPTSALSSNSAYSLNKLTAALSQRFPYTGVRTSCPATVVPFGDDASETTEVTPADYLRTDKGFNIYDIPDCSGGWMQASPDAHNSYVREADLRLGRKVKPLVRFLKAWKYYQNVPISSFYLELRIAKYTNGEPSIVYAIDTKRVFAHLYSVDLARIQDPMGVSGYVSPCKSDPQLSEAKSKLSTALTRANKAREAECDGRIKEAFDWWRKLFTNKFPGYYK